MCHVTKDKQRQGHHRNRKKEVLLTRLKFRHSLLNKYQFNIGLTTDKNCAKEEETPKHLDYPIFTTNLNLQETFPQTKNTDIIYEYFKLLGRTNL